MEKSTVQRCPLNGANDQYPLGYHPSEDFHRHYPSMDLLAWNRRSPSEFVGFAGHRFAFHNLSNVTLIVAATKGKLSMRNWSVKLQNATFQKPTFQVDASWCFFAKSWLAERTISASCLSDNMEDHRSNSIVTMANSSLSLESKPKTRIKKLCGNLTLHCKIHGFRIFRVQGAFYSAAQIVESLDITLNTTPQQWFVFLEKAIDTRKPIYVQICDSLLDSQTTAGLQPGAGSWSTLSSESFFEFFETRFPIDT